MLRGSFEKAIFFCQVFDCVKSFLFSFMGGMKDLKEPCVVCTFKSVCYNLGEQAESFWQKGEKMAACVPSELFVFFPVSKGLEGRPHALSVTGN